MEIAKPFEENPAPMITGADVAMEKPNSVEGISDALLAAAGPVAHKNLLDTKLKPMIDESNHPKTAKIILGMLRVLDDSERIALCMSMIKRTPNSGQGISTVAPIVRRASRSR